MLVFAFSHQTAHGPHWFYFNSDPDYFYLCDSITVAQFKVPDCVLHPGTPVTVLGAFVMRIVNLFIGKRPFIEDVLAQPERYLFWMNAALLYPLAGLSLYSGWRVMRSSGCYLPAFLLQLAPFLSFTVMDSLATFKPEPMQVWASLLLGMWLIVDACTPVSGEETEDSQRQLKRRAIGYGVLVGFGLAVKFTSIPYGLLPLLVLPFTRKVWITYGVACIGSFLFFVLPALPRWKWFYKNLVLVSSHSGLYGAGEEAKFDLNLYYTNSKQLLLEEPWFACVLGVSILAALVGFFVFKNRSAERSRALHFLAALTCIEIIHVILTAKQPAVRYLVPSYTLAGANFALMYQLFKKDGVACGWDAFKAGYGFVATLFAAWAITQSNEIRAKELQKTQARLAFCEKMEPEIKAGHMVFGHVASALENAVNLGNSGYSRSRYNKEVAAVYPALVFYQVPQHKFIKGIGYLSPQELADLCKAQPMKMLADADWAKLNCPPGFELKLIEKFTDESYFEIVEKK